MAPAAELHVKQPFFSIVMPSRDRPEQMINGIASVFQQDFADYEFILVDNSTNPDTFSKWYSEVAPLVDRRYRYLRSGGLAVRENFEFAFMQARGKYVLMLTDRMILDAGALSRFHQQLEPRDLPVMMFADGEINDPLPERDFRSAINSTPLSLSGFDNTHELLQIDSREIASKNINGESYRERYAGYFTPRFYNTIFANHFITSIRARYGRLINGGEPDTRMAFQILDMLPTIHFYNYLGNLRSSAKGSNAIEGRESLDVAFNQWSSASTDVKCALGRSPVGVLPLVGLGWYFEWLSVIYHAQGSLKGLTATNRAFVRSMASFLNRYPSDDPRVAGMASVIMNYADSVDLDAPVEWDFSVSWDR